MDRARIDSAALLAEAGWLRSLARHLVQDPESADDLVQDTWRRALERPAATPAAVIDPKAARFWLARVMRNLAKNRRRDDDVRAWHEKQASRSEAWTEDQSEDRVRLQRRLADAVLELPEPSRSAIVLRYFDGLSTQEVAERLGVGHDAARQRISRGLAGLRSKLDREYGEDRAVWCLLLGRILERPAAPTGALVIGGIMAAHSKVLLAAVAVLLIAALATWRAMESGRDTRTSTVVATSVPALDSALAPSSDPALARSPVLDAATTRAAAPAPDENDHDIHGEVLDPASRPVPGAHVEVFRNEGDGYSFLDTARTYDQRKIAEVETDAEGRFAVPVEIGRSYLVVVTSRGLAVERVGSRYAGEHVTVHMHRGASIVGHVKRAAEDAPVANARIRIYPADGRSARVRIEALTDDAGRFRFDDLAPCDPYVEALPETGSAPPMQRLSIAEGAVVEIEFVVRDGPTIRGTVVDATTRMPIANAEVGDGWTMRRTVRTNAQGEFEYAGFPEDGTKDLHVRADGYGRKEKKLRESSSDPLPEKVEIELYSARTARGRVLDEQGHPVGGAYVAGVEYAHENTMDWVGTVTEENGAFELKSLRADVTHTLLVRREGFGMIVFDFPESETKGSHVDFGDLQLPPPSLVAGIVIDETGTGIPDLEIYLRGANADRGRYRSESRRARNMPDMVDTYVATRRCRTDDRGRFQFTDLSAGSYEVAAQWRGASSAKTEHIEVPRAGTAKNLRIEVAGSLSLAGRVLDPEGKPVPRALVTANGMAEAEGSSGSSSSDASGRFRVRGLKKGTYRVLARESVMTMAPVEVTSIPVGREDLELSLRRPASIEGHVLDETEQPVPKTWVVARPAGGSGWGWGDMTDATGHFRVIVGENDVVDLEANASAAFESEVRVSNVTAGQTSVVIRLTHAR